MKTLKHYIIESEARANEPVVGDDFAIEVRDECLIESYVVDVTEDGIVIESDARMFALLEQYGYIDESLTEDANSNDPLLAKAVDDAAVGPMEESEVDEAKYQGREVKLGKPMAGDVKKSKVYVRGPKGNVVKVNFGDPNMKIKKSNPARRKSFRARHNCDNPGPRWKARYWSCRAW